MMSIVPRYIMILFYFYIQILNIFCIPEHPGKCWDPYTKTAINPGGSVYGINECTIKYCSKWKNDYEFVVYTYVFNKCNSFFHFIVENFIFFSDAIHLISQRRAHVS